MVIVNDCSTDNTFAVISEYANKDSRISIINNEVNKKLPASLNIGFSVASGDSLTWTSDDNSYHANAFETMVKAMRSNPNIDMVYADFDVVDLEGKVLWHESKKDPDVIKYMNTVGACFLYKKSLADRIGEYDTNLFLAEDYEFWIKAYLNGKLMHISESLYDYGWHDKSLTATRKSEISKATYKAKKKHEDELLSRCVTQDDRNRYYDFMLSHLKDKKELKAQRKEYYRFDGSFAASDMKKRVKGVIFHILRIG